MALNSLLPLKGYFGHYTAVQHFPSDIATGSRNRIFEKTYRNLFKKLKRTKRKQNDTQYNHND